ncbi:MAG: serine hydrolase, partial [Acidobacteria bacterium]|nr:serine hydrolase [Acidobacteriota bacterium]
TSARLFGPLGMTRTVFRDDHTMLVRDRAYAYARGGVGGYRLSIPDFAIVGASSLFTTVEDLSRWNGNFTSGEIGGPDVLRQLQARGALDDGARLSYAFGLAHGTHRGRPTIGHGGTDAAYRSEFLRFPDEDLAVAVLCNTDRAAPGRLARDVADVFLPPPPGVADPAREARRRSAPRRLQAPAAGRGETGGRTADPASLAGYYLRTGNDVPLRVIASGDDLVLVGAGAEQSLHPAGGARSRPAGPPEVPSPPGGAGGRPPTLRIGDPPRPVYSRELPVSPSAEALAAYAGSYYSDDLAVGYTFRVEAGRLVLWNRKLGRIPLAPTFADGFYARGWSFTFRRDDAGAVSGFTVSTSRAWNIAFGKRG